MSQSNPQVLVVGAGPTGLGTAIELRRRGIDCRIIERRPGPIHTSRAITVHARTMEVLEDMGIVERFLHGGIKNYGYIFNFKGSDMKPGLDYSRLPTRYPYVCMFNQNETEKILRDHLEHELGLPVEWSTELTSIVIAPAQCSQCVVLDGGREIVFLRNGQQCPRGGVPVFVLPEKISEVARCC